MSRILPGSYEMDITLQLTMEDDLSFRLKPWEVELLLPKPNDSVRPAIADSCYIDMEEVFGFKE